jgi:hypothetical protein
LYPSVPVILLGAALCLASSLGLGIVLIDMLRLEFRKGEKAVLGFIVGSALLSDIVFALAAAGWARKGVFVILTALVLVTCLFAHRRSLPSLPAKPIPRAWTIVSVLVVAAFSWFYIATALAPETSSDGMHYHLGLVARYARIHGFERNTTNLYASLSQGLEMLFLDAFSVGKHSSAALVHLAFLFALALAMLRYSQRYGMPVAGVCGALLTFAAPVVGIDAASAYNDVAAACVVFGAFYLLRIWMDELDLRLAALAGLCAGFAYAIKYSAGLALIYGLGLICFRLRRQWRSLARSCAVFLLFASILIAPWAVKNWVYVGNPVAPFFNRLFPNPYVTPDFEDILRAGLRHWNQLQLADMPLEVTIRGYRPTGLFGWAYLLTPVGLLAVCKKEGRHLMVAAIVFALPVLENKGSRFLIPAVPFFSLVIGMVLARLPLLAGTVVLAHALTNLPPVLSKYCHPWAWRLEKAPWSAALRITPEERYIVTKVAEYPVSQMLDARVPPGARVFSFDPIAQSYCARDVVVSWWGAENIRLWQTLQLPLTTGYRPMLRLTFHFHARPLYGIRVVQTAAGTDIWKISELRLMHSGIELPEGATWHATAKPSPWNADLAVDRRPITCWRANQALFPGMFYEVTFGGGPQTIDSVMVDCPNDQRQIRLRLEGEAEPGLWDVIDKPSESANLSPAFDLRHAATGELKRSGIPYILISPGSYIEQDVKSDPGAWGLAPVDHVAGWYLYRIA